MSFFFPVSTSSEKHKGYCFFFTIEQLLNSLKKAIAFFFFKHKQLSIHLALCVQFIISLIQSSGSCTGLTASDKLTSHTLLSAFEHVILQPLQ